jgi:hypothetical protein
MRRSHMRRIHHMRRVSKVKSATLRLVRETPICLPKYPLEYLFVKQNSHRYRFGDELFLVGVHHFCDTSQF